METKFWDFYEKHHEKFVEKWKDDYMKENQVSRKAATIEYDNLLEDDYDFALIFHEDCIDYALEDLYNSIKEEPKKKGDKSIIGYTKSNKPIYRIQEHQKVAYLAAYADYVNTIKDLNFSEQDHRDAYLIQSQIADKKRKDNAHKRSEAAANYHAEEAHLK